MKRGGSNGRESLRFLFTWLFISGAAAASAVTILYSFAYLLDEAHRFLESISAVLPLWTAAGAAITVLILYRISPRSSGEGIPSYIEGMSEHGGVLPLKATIFKFFSSLVTLGSFGAGGIIGPLGRVNSGLLSGAGKKIFKDNRHIKTAGIAGFAAITGLVFNAPLGGGIFAVEILQTSAIPYVHLFPAILASSLAVFTARVFDLPRFFPLVPQEWAADPLNLPYVIGVAFLAGLGGKAFNQLYRFTAFLIKREQLERLWIKALIGGTLGSLLIWLINPLFAGTGISGLYAIFLDTGDLYGGIHPGVHLAIVCLVMLIIRSLGTCLTIGTGLSAGITGTVAIGGLLIGCGAASIIGIPMYSGDYYAFLAAGFAGMLGSSMNIPIAAAVLGIEVFGLEYSLPSAVAAIIGYQVNRHHTVYDYFESTEGY